jgi:4a-hydroxytetrahydrobiopterin dehydratase
MTSLTADEFSRQDGIDDWRYILGAVHAEFGLSSFGTAGEFVAAIAEAADAADHHPDIALCYPGRVRVSLRTHVARSVTTLDVELARAISAMARERNATASPLKSQGFEIAIDTMDADRIRPFWAAVMGYVEADRTAVVDPQGHGPAIWFQQMDEPRAERQRFHIDVSVPHDAAEQRVAAAIAAGGRLVTDQHARSWWILADADGNEACVCTWQDRN